MTLATITVASHHFVVTGASLGVRAACNEFSRTMILYGRSYKDRFGQMVKQTEDRLFAFRTPSASEFRYHINQLEDFKKVLHRHRLDTPGLIEWKQAEDYQAAHMQLTIQPDFVPEPLQQEAIQYIVDRSLPATKAVILQAGGGKEARLSSAIKIPGGWTTMGQIQVGDTVTAWDGTPTKVVGVYPQGRKTVYRITFNDGRFTDVGAEHLWKIFHGNAQPHKQWRVVNTLEIQRLLTSVKNKCYYIPLIQSEIGEDADLPMDPYSLGVILGDGCISHGAITVTKGDPAIFDAIEDALPFTLRLSPRDEITQAIVCAEGYRENAYTLILRRLNLMGCRSHEKFIPVEYLHGSTSQRLALLQGLLDTDGYASENGAVSFSSSSEQLAKDVQYLARSLGWIASISNKNPTYPYLGEKKDGLLNYQVNIRSTKPADCFRLLRKKERVNNDNQYAKGLKLRIENVEVVGEDEMQCIAIDHPDKLYVTDDFIVTHNTFTAMFAASEIEERMCIFLEPKYIGQWLEAFQQNCVINKKRICVISGDAKGGSGNALRSLINMAFEDLPYDAIIVSTATFRNYIDDYKAVNGDAIRLRDECGYEVPPHQFLQHIKAGIRVIDEVHENFWFMYMLDLFTNVHTSVSLSATLFADDPFVNSRMQIAYPTKLRFDKGGFNKYVHAYSLHYSFRRPSEIKSKQKGSGAYSHVEFEKSLMKSKDKVEAYFNMVYENMKFTYDAEYRKGDRCLVYFATIELCTRFTEWIKRKYLYHDARRFVGEDPLENLLTADISVSTLKSAGTGKDIPQLTTVIMTPAVNSSPSNIQGFGRIRDLNRKNKALGRKMFFVYFVCDDIVKHLDYHHNKKELLKTRALKYEPRYYGTVI